MNIWMVMFWYFMNNQLLGLSPLFCYSSCQVWEFFILDFADEAWIMSRIMKFARCCVLDEFEHVNSLLDLDWINSECCEILDLILDMFVVDMKYSDFGVDLGLEVLDLDLDLGISYNFCGTLNTRLSKWNLKLWIYIEFELEWEINVRVWKSLYIKPQVVGSFGQSMDLLRYK